MLGGAPKDAGVSLPEPELRALRDASWVCVCVCVWGGALIVSFACWLLPAPHTAPGDKMRDGLTQFEEFRLSVT